MVVICC